MSFKVENVSESISADKAKFEANKKSVLSRYSNSTQTIPVATNTKISWWTQDEDNSLDDTGLSVSVIEARFTNSTQKTIVYSIDGFVGWNIGATPGTIRNCFLVKNGNVASNQGRIGYSSLHCISTTAFPINNFQATVILKPDEYFEVFVYHNENVAQQINSEINLPGSRINITKL